MGKPAVIFAAILLLFAVSFAADGAQAISPTGMRAAIERTYPAEEAAACREKRWGWHGWGWYPCRNEPVNTCEKCRWRWGYKYCWRVC